MSAYRVVVLFLMICTLASVLWLLIERYEQSAAPSRAYSIQDEDCTDLLAQRDIPPEYDDDGSELLRVESRKDVGENVGYWQRRPRHELIQRKPFIERFQRCVNDIHQNCDGQRREQSVGWSWHSTHSLRGGTPEVSAWKVISQCLDGKRIAIVGDSLNRQFTEALRCRIAVLASFEADKQRKTASHHTISPKARPIKIPKVDIVYIASPYFCAFSGSRDAHASGFGAGPVINYTQLDPRIKQAQPLLLKSDMIILNSGLWNDWRFDPLWDENYAEGLSLAFRYFRDLQQRRQKEIDNWQAQAFNRARQPQKLPSQTPYRRLPSLPPRPRPINIIWRTTPSRHWAKGDWDSNGNCPFTMPDANATFTWFNKGGAQLAQNSIASRLLGEFTVLDVVPATLPRADGHPVTDCTHFCQPGVIDDAWVDMLLRLVWDKFCS